MYSSPRSILAVGLSILVSFSGSYSFAQSANFLHAAGDPRPLAKNSSPAAPCTNAVEAGPSARSSTTRAIAEADAPCDTSSLTVPLVNPCNSPGLAQPGCPMPKDIVQDELAALGKTGQKIQRAREKVLEILQSENSCSAWYREKDSDPFSTFRSLTYRVDQSGPEFVVQSREVETLYHFHDPYVAKIGQATGAYATITLNANGAFFRSAARVLIITKEGGPMDDRGARYINVGLYGGDTLQARVLVLLHEFGHSIDLLPADGNDDDGKSVQNTGEVLHYCRSEIESKHSRTLSASR